MDMEQPNPKAQHSQIDFQNSRDNTDDNHSVKICPSIEDLAGTKSISACTICGKSFKRPGYLQHHTSCHTETHSSSYVQPRITYMCPVPNCNHHFSKGFTAFHSLRRHFQRTHVARTLTCPREGCSKRFSFPADLKAHLQFCGQKLYCEICGQILSAPSSLRIHKMRKHNINIPTNSYTEENFKPINSTYIIRKNDDDDDDEEEEDYEIERKKTKHHNHNNHQQKREFPPPLPPPLPPPIPIQSIPLKTYSTSSSSNGITDSTTSSLSSSIAIIKPKSHKLTENMSSPPPSPFSFLYPNSIPAPSQPSLHNNNNNNNNSFEYSIPSSNHRSSFTPVVSTSISSSSSSTTTTTTTNFNNNNNNIPSINMNISPIQTNNYHFNHSTTNIINSNNDNNNKMCITSPLTTSPVIINSNNNNNNNIMNDNSFTYFPPLPPPPTTPFLDDLQLQQQNQLFMNNIVLNNNNNVFRQNNINNSVSSFDVTYNNTFQ